MTAVLSILFPLNFLLAIYMAYRIIRLEERNATFLPLVAIFLSSAILSFQELQILHVQEEVVIEYFIRSHALTIIWILFFAMVSSISFLYPPAIFKKRTNLLYLLAAVPASILIYNIGFKNNLSHLESIHLDGVWYYKLIELDLTASLFMAYTILAGFLITSCFWVQHYQKHQFKFKNISVLILQSIIILSTCVAFMYLPKYYAMTYSASPPITICAIGLVWIFNNFSLGKINSSLALNDILNSMSNILIITNKDLKVVEINNEALKKLDLKREAIEGKSIFMLVRLFQIENWKELAKIIKLKKTERSIERLLTINQGEHQKYINLSVKPHHNKRNEIAGYVFLGTDITEVHLQQLAIKEHTSNLERTNKELERFAYIASHDLKTPLRSVVSFLDLIERRIVKYSDKDLKEFVYLARQGASQMYHLIQDILEFSRVDQADEEKVSIDLNETVFNICHTLRPTINEKKGELLISNLPMVKAEKIHMTQLFTNLIENGFKYNEGQKPTVKVNYRKENGRHVFAISDNGIGVEQAYYDQIFEMFKRLHTNPNHEGSGIGLSICKKIVDIYKGEIWLESKVNEGTTFFFTLQEN